MNPGQELDGTSRKLKAKAFLGLGQLVAVIGFLLFLASGTTRYVQGWIFLLTFFGCSLAITVYLMKNDPKLLARRVAAGPIAEKRARQKGIQVFASLAFLAVIVIPALDHRLGWSRIPLAIVVLGLLLVGAGFVIVFLVFRENSFASAVIEVGTDQKVIETGPYAAVRHPMYAGALVLLSGTPLALGSLWGLLTLVPFVAILVWRLLDEESVLAKELPGYEDYRGKVRYRLLPGVW